MSPSPLRSPTLDTSAHPGQVPAGSFRVEAEGDALRLWLSGPSWAGGPLADEDAWIGDLSGRARKVVVDLSACPRLGAYTLQWLLRLGARLRGAGGVLSIASPPPGVRAQLATLGLRDTDLEPV